MFVIFIDGNNDSHYASRIAATKAWWENRLMFGDTVIVTLRHGTVNRTYNNPTAMDCIKWKLIASN